MKFSEDEKAMWLEDWRRSGKRAWTYAKENGLSPQTFLKWTKGKAESNSCFVEVSAKAIAVGHGQEILIEKGGLKIHVPLTVGGGELRAILDILAGAA